MSNKIIINGSEPDDIKLNGVTPDKIMLNGQCYFEKPFEYLYKWDFTKSLTDEVAGAVATMDNETIFTEGVGITGNGWIKLGDDIIHKPIGKIYEIDFASFEKTKNNFSRVLGVDRRNYFGYDGRSYYASVLSGVEQTFTTSSNIVSFTNKTLKLVFVSDSSLQVYLDDTLFYDGKPFVSTNTSATTFYIGNPTEDSTKAMETFTVTGVRIYENEE